MTDHRPPLLDAQLARKAPPAAEVIEAMAQDLLRYAAHGDERAAIRILSGRGYGQGQIIALVDKARARAVELAVAREMAKP